MAGTQAQAVLTSVRAACASLATAGSAPDALSARDLTCTARDLLAAIQLAEASLVAIVGSAIERGVVAESTAADATQWVHRLSLGEELSSLLPDGGSRTPSGPLVPVADADDEGSPPEPGEGSDALPFRVPGIERAAARRIATVAQACTVLRNAVVRDAVAAGTVSPTTAKIALDEVDRTMHLLPHASRDEVFGYFFQAADLGSPGIRRLVRELTIRFGDENHVDHDEEKLDATERLRWIPLPNGHTRLEADLSPLHAAQITHAINALSAPAPGNDCCTNTFHRHTGHATGVQDTRPPEKRRIDALLMLLTRAADLIDTDNTITSSGSATIIVTIDFDALAGKVTTAGHTTAGHSAAGHTETGQPLTPATIRQLACDANIIPMILGSHSEPLDVGRTQRLVKGGLRRAVIERDRCCTFPGCDRPPPWCNVHHIIPWESSGPTSLENSALLCQRHHTIVHQQELTARADKTGVTWDLHPGRMPHTAA